MNLIIFGAQGSGKGTQAKLIAKKLNYIHLSTGSLFREEIKKGTNLGKLADSLINKGHLVPDNITNKIVLNKIKDLNSKNKKIILDGYPRNINQAKFLIDKEIEINKVIVLNVDNKKCIKRISSRYHCPNCGREYNIAYDFLKPKKEGICDKCKVKLIQREDDHKEAVKKRLEIYYKKTKPILDLFEDKIININGEQSIKKVNKDILKVLKKN